MSAQPEPRVELIEAKVRGRYLVRASQSSRGGLYLVGFHGYGENAEALLPELERIPGLAAWRVVVIQALHPFYNSRTGDVVASWMTRLDREEAIADNVRYVSEVVRRETGAGAGPDSRLVYLGFSQGTAMAYRAAAGAGHRCHGLVALGGDVPPELGQSDLPSFPRVLIGRGRRDEWYSEDKLEQDQRLLSARGIDCRTIRFDGGHEWTDEFRDHIGAFLREVDGDGPA